MLYRFVSQRAYIATSNEWGMMRLGFPQGPSAPVRGQVMDLNGDERHEYRLAHPRLSIVIPAYNECLRIEGTLERVMWCIRKRNWDAEVLVVDDGSTDETVDIVQRWMRKHER